MDDEIYLEADYNKLKQVFHNIIKNSIESSSKNINISYRIMFGRVTIIIKDDGMKIDNDAIYKLGNYFTNKENGNGIGTSLIKKIVSMHNGKIKYRNNKNKGVSVYITLTLS
jgi:signal transduction histidine kinase